MAYRFGDTINYTSTAAAAMKWNTIAGGVTAGVGRRGGNVLSFANRGLQDIKILTSQPTWVVGCAFYTEAGHLSYPALYLRDGTSNQCELRISPTGEIQVTRNGSQLAITSGLGFTFSKWHFLEFKVTIDASGSYAVRLDGVVVLSGSGNTQATGNASANQIVVGGIDNLKNAWYCDIYVLDGTGTINNDFLGDRGQYWKVPVGPGDLTEWTPSTGANWENVDDASPDSDSTYNSSATPGQRDNFAITETGVGNIAGVQVEIWCRKDDAGARTIKPVVWIEGTPHDGDTLSVLDAYTCLTYIWEKNPATNQAWTADELNAATTRFGYELVA